MREGPCTGRNMMAKCARVGVERCQLFMQFLALERDNVGVYNSIIYSPTSAKAKVLYKLVAKL